MLLLDSSVHIYVRSCGAGVPNPRTVFWYWAVTAVVERQNVRGCEEDLT